MQLLFLDFETYYEKGSGTAYSLRNLTTHEYVLDDRFEVMCVALATDSSPVRVATAEQFEKFVQSADWSKIALVGHNLFFDGYILARRYGVKPKLYIDTMGLARAVIGGRLKSHSLDAVGKYLNLSGKKDAGAALSSVAGKRWADLTDDERRQLMLYAQRDVELLRDIFSILFPQFPKQELFMLHWTVLAACWPQFVLDRELLEEEIKAERRIRRQLVKEAGTTTATLMSNDKFAAALQLLGVSPPTKISLKTGKETWAFDKKDERFLALLEHEDPRVRALVKARLAVKSTIKETRAKKLLRQSEFGLPVPMPLNFSGATQTHRFSGADGMNPQNFPKKSRDLQGDEIITVPGRIRRAMRAGEGKKVIVVDSSNIELRVCHWLAGNEALLDQIRAGKDPYCYMASKIYNVEVNPKAYPEGSHEHDEHSKMRTIGKIALLGLQYGMGASKYRKTVQDWTGLVISEDEAQKIVEIYRADNLRVKQLWNVLDRILRAVASQQEPALPAQMGFQNMSVFDVEIDLRSRSLAYVMPEGLKISYPHLRIRDDTEEVEFYCPKKGDKRGFVKVWGGVVTENCWAGDTIVLTDKGFKPIAEVSVDDLVWDGEEFVSHGGVVNNGWQDTIRWGGARVTPNHRVWTSKGWQSVKSCSPEATVTPVEKLPWALRFAGVDCVLRKRWEEGVLDGEVSRLRQLRDSQRRRSCKSSSKTWADFLRVQAGRMVKRAQAYSWDEQTSCFCGLAQHDRSLSFAYTSCMEKLWWAWNYGLRTMARKFSKFLGRYGSYLSAWVNFGSDRQRWALLAGELSMGFIQTAKPQQAYQSVYRYTVGEDDCCRGSRTKWYRSDNTSLSVGSWLATGQTVHRAGFSAQDKVEVFDIVNCGPRHRYAVFLPCGKVVLAHNCTQALSSQIIRIQMREIMRRLKEELDLPPEHVTLQVHDEVVCVAPESKAENVLQIMIEEMSRAPAWAEGLPLAAEGAIGDSYGEAK